MEGQFQTSFIPKKPAGPQPTLGKPARTTNLFTIIVIIIFVTMILLTGAVYGYQFVLQNRSETVQDNLNTELNKLRSQTALINEISRLDTRLETTKKLLAQHVALTEFFEFLSSNTLTTVRYTGFRYLTKDQDINVSMTGEARSFASLALQADELGKSENKKILKGHTFTNYNLDKTGNVVFTLTTSLNKDEILYKKTLPDNMTIEVDTSATSTTQ